MEPKLKVDLKHELNSREKVVIELGCGDRKPAGRIGIDILDLPEVDIVADFEQGLGFLPDNSVDKIYAKSVLEHIDNLELLLGEMLRVVKPSGKCHIFVPHFSSPYYYSDYTHLRFFGLYTFYYFVGRKDQLYRKVPNFYSSLRLEVVSLNLVFRSTFRGINLIKKLFGRVVNINSLTQEIYEENLSWLIPCYGLEVVLRPVK